MPTVPRRSAAVAVAILLTLTALDAQAGGDSFTDRQDDLQLTADWTWAGCGAGGYYPIRIGMRNSGPTREFTVEFTPGQSGLPHVSRRVKVDQNATASFSLLIPMTGRTSLGQLQVVHDGETLERLSRSILLADFDENSSRPGILVISPEPVDSAPLEAAVASLADSGAGGVSPVTGADHAVIEPVLLPGNWVAYSGLDLVVISLDTLTPLAELERSAILNWVRTGGTLFVYNIEEAPRESEAFTRLVARDMQLSERDEWNDHSADVFATCGMGFGRVLGFRENPFDGSSQDGAWTLSASRADLRWAARSGVAGRTDNREFLHFLIPGNRSVPVFAFLIFISAFAFVIGPLNYYVLAKHGRLNFLVLTIPGIAVLTTVVLLTYSAASHGVDVKSRVRSLTLLDQNSQRAITTTRLALYAGLAPSDGLRFSPSTAVIPIWPYGAEFQNGRIDWTETQHLSEGWLPSRTRTQFLTVNVRPERGRLTIETQSDGSLGITNGLAWDLESLLVLNDGQYFYGTSVAAGAAAALQPVTADQQTELQAQLARSQPALPSDIDTDADIDALNDIGGRRISPRGRTEFALSTGFMERRIAEYRQLVDRIDQTPVPTGRRWLAVVTEPPGIEFGTETAIIDGWHLVIGNY